MDVLESLWPRVPLEYNFLAQDKDGTIKAFTHKPLKDAEDFYPNYLAFGSKELVVIPGGNRVVINWEDTVIKRGEKS